MEKRFSPALIKEYLVLSLILTAALLVIEIYFFPRYYSGYDVIENLSNGLYLRAAKIVVWAIPAYSLSILFFYAALISSHTYRVFYFLLFSAAVLIEYSYQNLFIRFTNAEDFANILFSADWRIRSNSAGEYFLPLGLIPCLVFLAFLIFVKPKQKQGFRNFLTVLLLYFCFFSITSYVSTNMFLTLSHNALYRTTIAFPINWFFGSLTQPALADFYRKPRQEIGFRALQSPRSNIVFIVDESMRGDHLSLNGYSRPTTPFLEKLNRNGLLKNWGIAVSATTCSTNSNNLLLTGVNELPDVGGRIYQYPSIFQYAKTMGYKTYYFDGQVDYRWNGKEKDLADFGEWLTPDDLQMSDLYENDAEIARRVRALVGNSNGNFIWINKFGVHAPYALSYPAEQAKWLPVPEKNGAFSLSGEDENERRINNYDNAVLYNSESFFTNLLGGGAAENTFYVYTSDHGQNLGEEGRTISHCSNTKNEANVPLFLIARPEIMPAADTGFQASHANLFATLLDLMDFPESERVQPYALSLLKAKSADSKPRYYFDGNLNSRHSNGKHLFDR